MMPDVLGVAVQNVVARDWCMPNICLFLVESTAAIMEINILLI